MLLILNLFFNTFTILANSLNHHLNLHNDVCLASSNPTPFDVLSICPNKQSIKKESSTQPQNSKELICISKINPFNVDSLPVKHNNILSIQNSNGYQSIYQTNAIKRPINIIYSCKTDQQCCVKAPFLTKNVKIHNTKPKSKLDDVEKLSVSKNNSKSNIDANFTILVEPKPNLPTRNISSTSTNSTNKTEEVYIETEPAQQESKLKEVLQSKNADKSKPKSQKREFNYASFDCGALILSSNKDAKHSTAILSNSKDSYLLNKCSSEKFVEVELCQDILVHQIALANFEYFSSMFKEFKIYGSSKLPPSWTLLGTYQGRNVRNRQYFDIQDPVLWTKYIRIEFVSHYGNEFYCPLTSLQVFGTTMIEDFKQFDDIDDEQQILYTATEVKNEVILPISQDSNSQSLNQDPKAPSLSSPNPTCLHPFFDPWKEIHSNIESISNNPTSSPFPKHSSIFTKIVNRLTMLEKTHISMENQQNRLQSMLKQHRIEKNVDLRELEVKLSRAIQEKGNDVNRGLLQLRKQRQELDEKLNFYTKMVDTLNYQV
ncbi:UNC-like C-terminal-domain-containing protein [Globomyces pollinis-pini]|nr:UNC-like C-terminal-domain-containing protein [Globomyces pollinis-pini]